MDKYTWGKQNKHEPITREKPQYKQKTTHQSKEKGNRKNKYKNKTKIQNRNHGPNSGKTDQPKEIQLINTKHVTTDGLINEAQ